MVFGLVAEISSSQLEHQG